MTAAVSVITTLFNCENFIKESLHSIITQDFDDFEWIIINDGSTDRTWDIVKSELKFNNVILIDNKDNKRIPTRRNEAIDVAKGEFIAIHDGDDISFPNRLTKQYKFMQENSDIFCVGGWAVVIDENSVEQRVMQYPPIKPKDVLNTLLHKRQNPIIDPTCMFRKNVFNLLGGYSSDKSIYTVPDMDLWARALVAGFDIANMSQCLIKYRINLNGMTRKHNKEMISSHNLVWKRFQNEMRTKIKEERV